VCTVCAAACHSGHALVPQPATEIYCDCGPGNGPSPCKRMTAAALAKDPQPLLDDSRYRFLFPLNSTTMAPGSLCAVFFKFANPATAAAALPNHRRLALAGQRTVCIDERSMLMEYVVGDKGALTAKPIRTGEMIALRDVP
jgi:hypothetical protein